jgi:ABC-type transport system involved in cytochrome c biogenesis permease subunit
VHGTVGTLMLLTLHLATSLVSDVLLMVAAVLSMAYLMQDYLLRHKKIGNARLKLPSIHVLDDIGLKVLTTAFVLMVVGIVAGSFLAMNHWGPRWYLDARQLWSVATCLLFAAVLIARLTVGWRGRKAAWVTLIGTTLVITGLLGLNYVTWTKHKDQGIVVSEGNT